LVVRVWEHEPLDEAAHTIIAALEGQVTRTAGTAEAR